MTSRPPSRADLLGVQVSLIRPSDALATIETWIAERSRRYVCITGVHGIIESRRDASLRAIHNRADMVTPDGVPLVWLARALGHAGIARVYGPDLMRAVTAISPERGYRQFYYGGAPDTPALLASRLRAEHPGLLVAGAISPPFRDLSADEDAAIVAAINAAAPDILWIGLSTPKQERWMAAHRERLDVPVIIGVGAAFDFLAGTKRQAPRWIGQSGLEWLFRLCTEPRRLWRRYLNIVPTFIALSCLALLKGRAFAASVQDAPSGTTPS